MAADLDAEGVTERHYALLVWAKRDADDADDLWRSDDPPVVLFTVPPS